MLYRIEVVFPRDEEPDFSPEECRQKMHIGPAAIPELAEKMSELGLPAPRKLRNRKTKFYFTELGWERFGKRLAAAASQSGYVLRHMPRRNIGRGNVIYSDDFQVALLPIGKTARRTVQRREQRRSDKDPFEPQY